MAGYAPLGAPNRPISDRPPNQEDPVLLQDSKIIELASKYKVAPAQICLRYQVISTNISYLKLYQFREFPFTDLLFS